MSGILDAVRRALNLDAPAGRSQTGRPKALVYRGPASLPGCPEAVAALLAASRWDFDVRYVGPKERLGLDAQVLGEARLYAQPGGGTLGHAYKHMRKHRDEIRQYVLAGGNYLGFCLGGYLAGATPGFGLLPGDTDQYIGSHKATIDHDGNAVVQVSWQGRRRWLFFQDGPRFLLAKGTAATVLATYPNRTVAAVVTGFGAGRVGVVGPHPEATDDWFTDVGLTVPDPTGVDLGLELVDAVMTP